jgi:hypothetical protein
MDNDQLFIGAFGHALRVTPYHFFPLWKRGMKGDLTAFQKAKLLPFFIIPQAMA